eukprot:scaffold19380_cov32-Prasinocladus_malaysianus.AAC.2
MYGTSTRTSTSTCELCTPYGISYLAVGTIVCGYSKRTVPVQNLAAAAPRKAAAAEKLCWRLAAWICPGLLQPGSRGGRTQEASPLRSHVASTAPPPTTPPSVRRL